MNSILPVYIVLIFAFLIAISRRAYQEGEISAGQVNRVYLLIFSLLIWTGLLVFMGINNLHSRLTQDIPLLWQAFVPVMLWMIALGFSRQTRLALQNISRTTPVIWFIAFQGLRLGAIGGVLKGLQGIISSNYVFWIGIPDFLFGVSAVVMAFMIWRGAVHTTTLIYWNLLGFVLIFFPTFLFMPYWMNEPGFSFIFEFPMILAPGIVVPLFISVNLMSAWAVWVSLKNNHRSRNTLRLV